MRRLLVTLSFLIGSWALFFSCTKKIEKETEKVLKVRVPAQIKGLDPAMSNDLYSSNEVGRVYEGLLQFHYLKRPYELIPNLASQMPEVSKDGLTYTFNIKKGVIFHDDECFSGGKGREMTAQDVIYSLKRIADPKVQSLGWWLFDGKIKGLNEWRESQQKNAQVDYSISIPGLQIVDDYKLSIVLAKPFPQFLYALAMPFAFVVAKEAVEKYGLEFMNHPVGTGPFITKKYIQGSKIIYTKNPNYHEQFYPKEGEASDLEKGLLEAAGKKLPFLDKVEVNVVVENQPAWMGFKRGDFDTSGIPREYFTQVIDSGAIVADYKKLGIKEEKVVGLDVTYYTFNMEDPLFKNNLKLRQAIASAYDGKKYNKLFHNDIAIQAQSILPPDLAGHDASYTNPYLQHDVELAKKLLKEAGYPEGKGLPAIELYVTASSDSRQMAEAFRDMVAEIGVVIKVNTVPWTELQQKVSKRQAPMFAMAWGADYPDAENFFQILYGPNKAPGANGTNFDDTKFNQMLEKASVLQDSPERTKQYQEIYRYVGDLMPMIFGFHRVSFSLAHGWIKNVKTHEFSSGMTKYYDIDLDKKLELLPALKDAKI